MRTLHHSALVSLLALASPTIALAQGEPPPGPATPEPPPPAAAAPAPAAPAPAAPAAAPVAAPASDVVAPSAEDDVAVSASLGGGVAASTSGKGDSQGPDDFDPRQQQEESTLSGATGLVRTVSADSGAEGTFRLGLIGTYYKGSNFLCGECALPGPTQIVTTDHDKVTQVGTRLLLSATPVSFLEAYASMFFQSTSNTKGDPQAIQIVGDTTLGVKAFMPKDATRILSFGGGLDTTLVSSPGGVSFDTANVGIRALGTADFSRQSNPEARIPLRLHLNLGYVFDNSGSLADDAEKTRLDLYGREQRITRIERFAHNINRVDHFGTGIGVEGVFSWVRPFGEWTVDVPVNRQSHYCGNNGFPVEIRSRAAGDDCLSRAGFSAVPSRVTLGARFYPWGAADWLRGLGFLAAVDIGTGATSKFIEEVAPERPWAIHVGVAWAVDATASRGPEKVVQKIVEVPAPPKPEHHIDGSVVVAGKDEPVPNAIIRFENKSITGMVANEDGKFRSAALDPGEYRLSVTADGFHDGQCTATIAEDKPAPAPGTPANGAAATPATPDASKSGSETPGTPATPPASGTDTPSPNTTVKCELEPLPRTATITGTVRNAETTLFVEGGTVTITDPLGRSLALKTDAEGGFRFGNVPAGKSKLTVEADGYLSAATEVTLEPRKDISTQLSIHERPKSPNVVITPTEIKLKKEVHFLHGSAEILPDSMAILEEAADALRTHADITGIEVQGHTDNDGTPEFNLKLSADRANAVRQVFIENGVDASRLTSHGYGQEKPLVPNTSAKNKAKNRRVQLVIVK